MLGDRLDLMTLKVFSNPMDSVIPFLKHCTSWLITKWQLKHLSATDGHLLVLCLLQFERAILEMQESVPVVKLGGIFLVVSLVSSTTVHASVCIGQFLWEQFLCTCDFAAEVGTSSALPRDSKFICTEVFNKHSQKRLKQIRISLCFIFTFFYWEFLHSLLQAAKDSINNFSSHSLSHAELCIGNLL